MDNIDFINSKIHPDIKSNFVEIGDIRIHYLSIGKGEPILMLHGWPTSSYLWRNMMMPLSKTHKVIALDLPGFGQSSKSLEASYSFNYYDKAIEGFIEELGISKIHLVVHDLGGPLGLYWAVNNPEKVSSLVLLNTLVYPEFSWAVKLFGLATYMPFIKNYLTSEKGLIAAIKFGVYNKKNLIREIYTNYYKPFPTPETRKVLLKTVQRLNPKGFVKIAEELPKFDVPVRLIYGENDKILPDIAKTMKRLKNDLPQAELTNLPNCGHFLQEDVPEKLSELLADFYNSK